MFCPDREAIGRNELGGACSTYVGEEKSLQGFSGET